MRSNAVFCLIAATIIGTTSMEVRHYAIFLPQLFILALIPDYQDKKVLKQYSLLFGFWLIGLGSVHILWAYLKYV